MTGKSPSYTAPRIEMGNAEALDAWLAAHADQATGVWLITGKVHTASYLPYDAIVETLIRHGWIDSLPRRLDNDRSMLYIAPRKRGSNWSRLNKARAEALIAAGRMTPRGLAAVETAKADGTWSALDKVEAGDIPEDLASALAANPAAAVYFDAFPRSTRRAILEWIGNAKSSTTREKRIAETVEKAAVNIRANQYRQPKSATPAPRD
ncbi:MAG: YdeI/OmpD-associated family protein [Asticcacaulis sp.]